MQKLVIIRPTIVLIAGMLMAMTSSVLAAGSDWLKAQNSRFRLISTSGVPEITEGTLLAGVEIELADGWKTYWRSPGDGLATEIDISASVNVAEARILWPAPKRFEGVAGLTSYGYKGAAILPIVLKPSDPDRHVTLHVKLVYGVCADICIPVEASAELTIPPGDDNEYAEILTNALARIPRKQTGASGCPHRLVKAAMADSGDVPVLRIETAHDRNVTGRDLFAERENGLTLPPAKLVSEPSSGQSIYAIRFDNADDASSLRDEPLTLTMTSEQGSCDLSLRIE